LPEQPIFLWNNVQDMNGFEDDFNPEEELARMNYPTVIWMGKEPLAVMKKAARRFRIVHRGPARANRPDDVPFALEQRTGQSMMKRMNWGPPESDQAKREAIHALSHAIGILLVVDLKALDISRRFCCNRHSPRFRYIIRPDGRSGDYRGSISAASERGSL